MILRRPYALLIKYFRVIHIALTILTIFIAYKSYDIVSLFQTYINNNYSITVTDNLASRTVSIWLIIAIIVVLVALIAVYILLRTKKKPNRMYMLAIAYYVLLFIMCIVAYGLISGLSRELWETTAARTYRDLARIIYIPQYIFIVLMFIRSLGFNVKQFNFKDDLKELEVTAEDNAEIELNINFETYKAERKIRRFIREFKYYFLENKVIFYVLGGILLIVIGYLIYSNYEKINYTYKEGDSFSYNEFNISITDSMITNVDLNGNSIYDGKYFVVIRFSISNNTNSDKNLDYNNLKLYYGSNYSTPVLDLGSYFKDFGNPFMNQTISAGASNTYIMAYMIDEEYINKSFYISIYLGNATKTDEFVAKTAKIKLSPDEYYDMEVVRNATLNEKVSFSSTTIGDSAIVISSALITSRYEYTYDVCYNENCRTYSDVVVADATYQTKQVLVVMDYELILDTTTASYYNINGLNAFASAFMSIEYVNAAGVTEESNVTYATPTNISDKLILMTDSYVSDATEINLLITIRNRRYVIKLI